MDYKKRLDLTRFDGGGAGGAAGAAPAAASAGSAETGVTADAAGQQKNRATQGKRVSQLDVEALRNPRTENSDAPAAADAAGQQQSTDILGQPNPEDKAKRWQGMIRGEFQDEFRAATSDIVQKRLGESNQRMQEMQTQIDSHAQTMKTLQKMLGTDSDDPQAIYDQLTKNSSLWDEAAARHGMDTPDYMRMVMTEIAYESEKDRADKLEQERHQQESARMKQEQDRAQFQDWLRQSNSLKEAYPNLDLVRELKENETFRRMLEVARLPVKDAYEFAHRQEIEQAKIDAVRQQMSSNLQARQARPSEIGTTPRATSPVVHRNPRDMTRAERAELGRRAMRGESITL